LAERLHDVPRADLVLALPRGGVPVAFEVARMLDLPLDLIMVRKIGAPRQPEFGIGAVVDGDSPQMFLNAELVEMAGASDAYLADEKARQLKTIESRRSRYLGGRPIAEIAGRSIIVVDDGIATGGTARAALDAMQKQGATHVTLAVPVSSREALNDLRDRADEIICLSAPVDFGAVGSYYDVFEQTTDEEVIGLLAQAKIPEP